VNGAHSNLLQIQTPEGIVFPLTLAGPVSRCLAWLIDLFAILTLEMLSLWGLGALGFISGDVAFAASIIAFFIISIGYPIAMEWLWRGQTLGKRLFRLRVMDAQGLRLKHSQVVVRNLLRFVDSLPVLYAVGGASCFVSKRCQRLGDIAANTIVVRTPELAAPDVAQVLAGKYNSFRDYPVLSARLRQRVSPQEAAIALQALIRRDELDPAARVELFGRIVMHARSIVEFPAEVTEGLADEQYVRNMIDIVFRRG
jgi:uncharacterized RDD family membrane protein YckC